MLKPHPLRVTNQSRAQSDFFLGIDWWPLHMNLLLYRFINSIEGFCTAHQANSNENGHLFLLDHPQAVIFHTEAAPFQASFKQCVTHGAYTARWQEVTYTVSTLVLMFFLPVVIMVLCYVAIITRITKEAKMASGRHSSSLHVVTQTSCATLTRHTHTQ